MRKTFYKLTLSLAWTGLFLSLLACGCLPKTPPTHPAHSQSAQASKLTPEAPQWELFFYIESQPPMNLERQFLQILPKVDFCLAEAFQTGQEFSLSLEWHQTSPGKAPLSGVNVTTVEEGASAAIVGSSVKDCLVRELEKFSLDGVFETMRGQLRLQNHPFTTRKSLSYIVDQQKSP